MAVSIPGAFIADPLRARRADRYFQFLLNDELDCAPNSLPHQLFQRTFPLPSAPAIPLHSVILRYPPASGCELWLNSPDLDAFLLFHQLPDTARTWDIEQKQANSGVSIAPACFRQVGGDRRLGAPKLSGQPTSRGKLTVSR